MMRRPPVWFKVAIALASLFASVLGLEVAVRVRQAMRYGSAGTQLYATQVDSASGLVIAKPSSQSGGIVINSRGFRSPEIEVPKPAGVVRFAFAGASTTFCAEVSSNEHTWPHLVSSTIAHAWPEVRVDYVNGAFPGYVVASSQRNLDYRLRPLQPDVVVFYEGVNDLSQDTRRLAVQQGLFTERFDESSGLARWSLLWTLIQKNVRLISRQRQASSTSHARLAFEPTALSAGFRERLTALVASTHRLGAVTALATFSQKVRPAQPADVQVRNANTHLYYMPYLNTDDIVRAFAEYNRVIREVAVETGAILIEDEDAIPADDAHFQDSIHFTDAGARAMAERVARVLLASPRLRALRADRGNLASAVAR